MAETPRVRVRALAKLNLDLRVLHKRPDGFHELRTIFQTISLADTLEIEYRPGRTRFDINSNLNIPDNIIVNAADSVLKATRKTGRIGFVLKKRIPLGGGLGGGSSDAAAVLLSLPALLGKPLPLEKLMELAASLGSDVPFFLMGGTALGLGRGTELYPLPEIRPYPILLIAPGIHSSTTDAYRALSGKFSAIEGFQSVVARIAEGAPPRDWNVVNDFEPVVFEQYPQLKSIKRKLLQLGARPVLMSGSGSSIFGVFATRQSRDRAAASFQKKFPAEQVHPVRMVSRRVAHTLLRAAFTLV